MSAVDSVYEPYKKAGLFLGLLQSNLGFGQLSLSIDNGISYFRWESVVRKEKRIVKQAISLVSLSLAKIPLDVWASDLARSMKNSMLHSHVKQESVRV